MQSVDVGGRGGILGSFGAANGTWGRRQQGTTYVGRVHRLLLAEGSFAKRVDEGEAADLAGEGACVAPGVKLCNCSHVEVWVYAACRLGKGRSSHQGHDTAQRCRTRCILVCEEVGTVAAIRE